MVADNAPDGTIAMQEWKKIIKDPGGALPPNILRTVGIGFFSVVLVGLVLSTMWSTPGEEAAEALAGTEPNLTGSGQVAQLSTRLTDLQEEQTRLQARSVEQAQRDADAEQALASMFGGAAGVAAGLGVGPGDGIQDVPATDAAGRGGGPGVMLTPDEIELRARLRLESLERRARSLRTPALVETFRPAPVISAVAPAAQAEAAAAAAQAEPVAPVSAPFDPVALMSQISDAATTAAGGGGGLTGVGADRTGCDGASDHGLGRCGDTDDAERSAWV